MTTDNKTLADVQPGGRVRLGDAELRKAIADVVAESRTVAHVAAMGNQTDDAQRCLDAAQQRLESALSAQPSPGGQDGPSNVDDKAVRQFLAGRAPTDVHREEILSGAYDHTLWFDHIRELMTALAARQPVGGPVAIPEGWALVDLSEYTVLPQIPTTAMMDAGWPIGEQITDRFDVKGAYADLIAEHDAKGEGIIHGPSQQPAQAMDLPYSLDADPAGIRARVCDVITGTLMVGAQGHTPPPVGHWAEPFWQAARADAKAQAVDLGRWSQRHADDLHVAVHTALSVHAGSLSQKKRAAISAYVKRLLIDSQAAGK